MRRILLLLPALLISSKLPAQVSPTQPAQLTTEQIAAQARNAVVLLRVYDNRGRQIALGSGFIARDRRVVTNSHVVEGADHVEVVDADGKLLLLAPFAEAVSTTYDVAVLPAIPSPVATLLLAAKQPAVGAAVVAIGAPEGLSNTVSTGIVSAIRKGRGGDWIQISAPLSSGSSGGPVLNASGEVIGISVAQLVEGQNLNFAIPAAAIGAMIASPAGHLAFPAISNQAETDNRKETGAAAPNVAAASRTEHKSMAQAVPATALATIRDTEFSLLLYGCFGNESGGAVVCVVDFYNPSRGDRVSLYRATISDAANRSANADGAGDDANGYRIGNDNSWMPIGGRGTTRVYVRFQTQFTPDVAARLVLQLGGPFVKRTPGFPATQIQVIRASADEQRRFFGFP